MLKNIIFALLSLSALAAASPLLAAEQAALETVTVQETAAPVEPAAETIKQPSTTQPLNDNHVDYRYCLELKTDREIAECRYKK